MRRWSLLLVALALAWSAPARTSTPPTPILVELFTSEGCSSCPPADALLRTLVETQPVAGAQVIGLGQHVDYWDRQGWRDRFSSAASTDRQQRYAHAFNIDSIYTPQMVVDGREELVGSDGTRAHRTIVNAAGSPHALVSITLEPSTHDAVA